MFVLYFDGTYRTRKGLSRKDGLMGYGWLIHGPGDLAAQGCGMLAPRRDASSSLSEYLALIEGLKALARFGARRACVEIRGDARSIIEQMKGTACVRSVPEKALHRRAMRIAGRFRNAEWVWIPRRQNRLADMLCRQAMVHRLKDALAARSAPVGRAQIDHGYADLVSGRS
jgi:ribonuclease HI